MRPIVVVTCFSLSLCFCYGQRFNTVYYGISSDSLHPGHQIEFMNGTTLELSSFPRHMSQQFRLTFNYKKTNKTLKIYRDNISRRDSIALVNNGFNQYLNHLILTIEGKVLTDDSDTLVYVILKDFKNKYNLLYIIDGKIYKQQMGLFDTYGLIHTKTKENKVLKSKMASMKDDLDHYDVKIYRGLDAYNKFGYESVFGVIELKRKMKITAN